MTDPRPRKPIRRRMPGPGGLTEGSRLVVCALYLYSVQQGFESEFRTYGSGPDNSEKKMLIRNLGSGIVFFSSNYSTFRLFFIIFSGFPLPGPTRVGSGFSVYTVRVRMLFGKALKSSGICSRGYHMKLFIFFLA